MDKDYQEIYNDFLRSGKNSEEEKRFAGLFRNKKTEPEVKQKMRKEWEDIAYGDTSSRDLSHILYKLHFLINSNESDGSARRGLYRIGQWYSRVASLLLLPLLTLMGAYLLTGDRFHSKTESEPSMVEVVAPMGSRIRSELPDGTSVWLNGGSVLKYQIPFDKRNVMVKGEAFFDVETDSLRPFLVEGKHGCVKVLGTRFNVKMWPDEDLTEVVLEEGDVELLPRNSDQKFGMKPGEMLVLDSKKKDLKRSHVNPERYSAWIDGKLMFRGDDMEIVGRELSRWFNVEVELKDSTLKDYVFRATFEDENLEEVMRLLKMTSPIDYDIIDNKQDSEGHFSKKKVIISAD
ncbi:MAG: DUF4974 domain-containing protein [Marinilabilia sp.]